MHISDIVGACIGLEIDVHICQKDTDRSKFLAEEYDHTKFVSKYGQASIVPELGT